MNAQKAGEKPFNYETDDETMVTLHRKFGHNETVRMKSGFCKLENLTGIRAIGLEKTPMIGENLEGIPFETEVKIAV